MTIQLNTQQLKLVLKKHNEINKKTALSFTVSETPYTKLQSEIEGAYIYDFYLQAQTKQIVSKRDTEIQAKLWNGGYKGVYVPTEKTVTVIKDLATKVSGNDKDMFDKILDEKSKEIIQGGATAEPNTIIENTEKKETPKMNIMKGDFITVKYEVKDITLDGIETEAGLVSRDVIVDHEQTEENRKKAEELNKQKEEQEKQESLINEVINFAKEKEVDFEILADALLEKIGD